MGKSPTVFPYESFHDEEDAKALKEAFKGFGSDEDAIIEIITKRSNDQRRKIGTRFKTMYGKFTKHVVDQEAAFKDAQALLQAGELLFAGTDESVFNQVMCQRNLPQLRLVFEEYEKLVGHPIETAIENEFSGTIKDALLQLIECVRDRTAYLATRLHDSMAGIGTDDRTLVRIIVSRSEIDLEDIKVAYEVKMIPQETTKKALLAIVG
ncbi:hypothetical protein NQ314_014067 [Rhamnusium bicolor]|uniref:Annexin n=1 Tax=Rhamnusium bicolor TaxID=1586634 RepID=A0AAV8X495_9CUCU|nr:hypothetical protein NQ314_014067 [Rhamnusium bicolor]